MNHRIVLLITSLIVVAQAGCGGGAEKKSPPFFTSGNREADQRADQRMAKDEQTKGGGEGTGDKSANANEKKPLYDRLGGENGINSMVDDFVTRALADPRVNFERKGIKQGGFSIHRGHSMEWQASEPKVKQLKLHLAQFFSLATGGPTPYQGAEMKQAHAGLHITNAEFDASVGDLKATLDKMKIPNLEQKELLSIVESTRPQVVEDR